MPYITTITDLLLHLYSRCEDVYCGCLTLQYVGESRGRSQALCRVTQVWDGV